MKKMGGKEEARKRKQTKWNSHYLTELLLPREVTALAWQILQFLKEARNPVIYHISLFLKYFFILQQLLISGVCSVTQLCPTLCDSMDSSLPGSSVDRILQSRILECVAISWSRGSSRPRIPLLLGCRHTDPASNKLEKKWEKKHST